MEKQVFSKIVQSCFVKTPDEVQGVIQLRRKYPYSQVLHALSAKLAKEHNLKDKDTLLQFAAVVAADRTALKDLMLEEITAHQLAEPFIEEIVVTSPAIAQPAEVVIETKILAPEKPKVETKPAVQNQKVDTLEQEGLAEKEHLVRQVRERQNIEKTIDDVDMADTVIRDLKKLSESKHNFELLFADDASASFSAPPAEKKEDVPHKIIELKDASNGQEAPLPKSRKRKAQADSLIEELKTKQELSPESDRHKKQIEIIDQFIKVQPSIPAPKEKNLPLADLNTIRSGEFGDNIVSETLVEILVKQGKKERAIEVLKKLIWKYPQKKAYFASQIEDLKK